MRNPASIALSTILSDASLAREVRDLPPRALALVIDRVGLDDAAELVALASTEQLLGVFDDDLWKSAAPGVDEELDDARFALWLEVLAEAGSERVAETLAGLPEDFVALAVSRRVLVFDLDALATTAGDDPRADKALEASLSSEIGSWLLVARAHDGWDALLAALVTLDRDHHDLLERILDRTAAATEATVEDRGLYEVLTEAESLAEDVAAGREERRAKAGFVAPSSAKAFLRLCETSTIEDLARTTTDPITKGWLRDLDRSAPLPAAPSRLRELLRDVEAPPRRALPRARKPTAFARALEALPAAQHGRLLEELAYLTNVLVAGDGLGPLEAAERVMETCGRGFRHLAAESFGAEGDAVRAFRIGRRLETDPSRVSARRRGR